MVLPRARCAKGYRRRRLGRRLEARLAWEYKGKRADLDVAFDQLRQYASALDNPPLLIVSDMARFRIRTNLTNSVSATHEFALDDLDDSANRDKLKVGEVGECARGALHIQTVNSRHSEIKGFSASLPRHRHQVP